MNEKKGIENLKKLASGIAALGPVVEEMEASSGNLISKLMLLTKLTGPAVELVNINYKELILEAKDLDASEKEEVFAHFKQEFNLADDAIEAKVEAVLGFGLKLESLVEEGIGLFKSFKPAEVQA